MLISHTSLSFAPLWCNCTLEGSSAQLQLVILCLRAGMDGHPFVHICFWTELLSNFFCTFQSFTQHSILATNPALLIKD
jgi:hypothetical protein